MKKTKKKNEREKLPDIATISVINQNPNALLLVFEKKHYQISRFTSRPLSTTLSFEALVR